MALLLAGSLMSAGCFPHSARNRTIAEIVEGGVAVSGVVVEGLVQTGADCDMTAAPGEPQMMCKDNASLGGGIGVALILAGVIGFIATISVAEDDDEKKPPVIIKAADPMAQPAPTTAPAQPTTPATPPAPEPTPPAPAPAPAPATN
ncbi:MAG: hypothetical protein QM831_30620 [Kofleriaceae bacterium]